MSMTENAAKTCVRCSNTKPLSEFSSDRQKKDGLTPYCRMCRKADSKKYYENNKELVNSRSIARYRKNGGYTEEAKIKGYASHIKRNYGITAEDYNGMFIEQAGRCAVCGTHQNETSRRLLVDHYHDTKIVRGLLCYKCNTGIGMFDDNLHLVKNAVKYLEMTK